VVTANSIIADYPPRIEFKRSDTGKQTSCVDCACFTDEAKCMMEYANCWPLGNVCCSAWSLRTQSHGMKKCGKCDVEIPKYLTNRDLCGRCEQKAEFERMYEDYRTRNNK
jgi:hypothetical protein